VELIKRIVLLTTAVWLVLGAAAAAAGSPLKAAASFAVIADFVRQVGGGRVEVRSLVPATADPHSWEPTPHDARSLAAADVLFVNGAGYEEWLQGFVASAAPAGLPVIELAEGLEPLPGPSHSVHHESGDPHFWLSVPNAVHYVERIVQALMTLDPEHAQEYRERADSYVEQLWELDRWLLAALAEIPAENRLLVTYHNAFAYFAQRYGFTAVEFLVAHPDREPTARDMAALANLLADRPRRIVFAEPQFSGGTRYMQAVAAELGGEVRFLYSATLTEEIPTYIDMMRHNGRVLVEALR